MCDIEAKLRSVFSDVTCVELGLWHVRAKSRLLQVERGGKTATVLPLPHVRGRSLSCDLTPGREGQDVLDLVGRWMVQADDNNW
jgi:hypothetical protein